MRYPQLPFFGFLSAFLLLIILPSQVRFGSVATVSLLSWLFLSDVILGINSLIWAGHVDPVAPLWCDIASNFLLGATYAIPLAILCISLRLALISSPINLQKGSPIKRAAFEFVMCLVMPIVAMALHVIVQDRRFNIFEDVGCQAAIYNSVPSILIIHLPPLILCALTILFTAVAGLYFQRQRLVFSIHLAERSTLSPTRYIISTALSVGLAFWTGVLHTFELANAISMGLLPWRSLRDVHAKLDVIGQLNRNSLSASQTSSLFVHWAFFPTASFILFALLIFEQDAASAYKGLYRSFRFRLGNSPKSLSLRLGFGKMDITYKEETPSSLRQLQLPMTFSPRTSVSSLPTPPKALDKASLNLHSRFSIFARDFLLRFGSSSKNQSLATKPPTNETGSLYPSSSNLSSPYPWSCSPSPRPTTMSFPDSWTTFSSHASPVVYQTHSKTNSSVSITSSRLTLDPEPYSTRIYISEPHDSSPRRTPSPPPFSGPTVVPRLETAH